MHAVKDIVTVDEAARFLRKSPSTVRRWIETKQLKARHIPAGGHGIYVMLRSDLLETLMEQRLGESVRPAKKKEQRPANQKELPLGFK